MLSDVDFEPVYASGEHEPAEFFLDALVSSNTLDLGLGYFSSSGFRALAIGFAYFIKQGGKMRMFINHMLSEEDKQAIQNGQNAKVTNKIEKAWCGDLLSLKETLSKKDLHFFRCLSWLIASDCLEIKATIPKRNQQGIVHQKFGLFQDRSGNQLAFNGSVNFSANALFNNVESLSCDFSWDEYPAGQKRVQYFEKLFYQTWNGLSEAVEIIPIEQTKTVLQNEFPVGDLNELLEEEQLLLHEEKNYLSLPDRYLKKVEVLTRKLIANTTVQSSANLPVLRDYQQEAIMRWKENNYQGILAMATGTGKTFTALRAIWELIQEQSKLFIIISCPFIHLAEQWIEEAHKFGLNGILVGESRRLWEDDASRQAQLFRRDKIDRVVLVTTNASFSSDVFQKIITPSLAHTLLIVDEVHYAGATSVQKLLPADCPFRLGLSATPDRHGDEEGTQALFDYFGNVVFSLPIEQAIGRFLTPYYYYPVPVELTEEEFDEYSRLTNQIIRLMGKKDELSQDKRNKLAIRRARVQNNSVSKLSWLRSQLDDKPLDYSLVYAGDQIFDQAKLILGKELKVKVHEFTSRQTRRQRKQLLTAFAKQEVQSLLAMKCLDEGVDVPPTRVAYFLASSSNPREFVQRRGRVLRKHPGKEHATIYDLVSIPPRRLVEEGRAGKSFHAVKSAFTKEYKRVQEFANMAINKYDAMNELFAMADQLDLLDTTKN